MWAPLLARLPPGAAPAADLAGLQQLIADAPAEWVDSLQGQVACVLGAMQLLREQAEGAQQQLRDLLAEPSPSVLVAAGQGKVQQQQHNAAADRNTSQQQAAGGRARQSLRLQMGSSRLSQMLQDLQLFRSSEDSSSREDSIWQRTLGFLRKATTVRPSRARAADTSGRSPAQQFSEEGVASLVQLLHRFEDERLAAEKLLCAEGMQDLLTSSAFPGGWEWACRLLAASMLLEALDDKDHTLWVDAFERALFYSKRRLGNAGTNLGGVCWVVSCCTHSGRNTHVCNQ